MKQDGHTIQYRVLTALEKHGVCTIAELAIITRLKLSQVRNVLNDPSRNRGWVVERRGFDRGQSLYAAHKKDGK